MGLNIGGATLTTGTSKLDLTNQSKTMSFLNNGTVQNNNQVSFACGGATQAFITPGAGWLTMILPTIQTNIGGGLNANGRFTAPVAGTYYFMAGGYCRFTASIAEYMHPIFLVNGAGTTYHGAGNNYRIRHYGLSIGRDEDTQINEIYQLAANDYVEFCCYFTAGASWYPYYNTFAGCLLG